MHTKMYVIYTFTWDVCLDHHTQAVIDFEWKERDEEAGKIRFCNIYERVGLV